MGSVFAIKRYALHDGPAIRTTIFLKGCPLKCWWCHNPEGMDRQPSLVWNADKCAGCRECLTACPSQSLVSGDSGIIRDPIRCTQCLACVNTCPALAHEAVGWEASVAEIIDEIEKDTPFYDQSGGGVTFSGGEPLMQPQFLRELLDECGRLEVHRAVDTSAYAPTGLLMETARRCELFLIDLKHMRDETHRLYTGVSNELIKKNITTLNESDSAMRIRIPLINGVNTDHDNLRLSGEFLAGLPHPPEVDLLPYHSTASAKYTKMKRPYPAMEFPSINREEVAACAEILANMGLTVRIGG